MDLQNASALLRLVVVVPLVLFQGIDHLPPLEHRVEVGDQLLVVVEVIVFLSNIWVNGTREMSLTKSGSVDISSLR